MTPASRPRIVVVGLGPGGADHVTVETQRLIDEMAARINEDETSAPYRDGDYYYYYRYEAGKDYPIYYVVEHPRAGGTWLADTKRRRWRLRFATPPDASPRSWGRCARTPTWTAGSARRWRGTCVPPGTPIALRAGE